MHVEVLTLRYDPVRGILDDSALQAFVRDKVVLAVRDHFFLVGAIPHLALVIEYRLATSESPVKRDVKRPRESGSRTDDLRESLPPPERALFDALRRWRAKLARDDGVPAYAVLTNAEFLSIARTRPASRKNLLAIDGLGRKRAERYAKDLLSLVAGDRTEDKAAEAKSD